ECVQGDSICILEIGALYGVSLAILYNHAITRFSSAKVVCLDPFDGYYGKALDAALNQPVNDLTFIRNMRLANVPDSDYCVIKQYSTKPEALASAKELSINLLIIDGDHSYEGIKYDFDNYFPLLQPGGYVIFDDYNAKEWPGVQKFIDEDVKKTTDFEYIGSISRTAVGRKRRQ
ncbi:MAG: class I SAM-dependent methyltransferase, partial [Alphaproteobacteria bacterium]